MHYKKLFPGKYLKAADLDGQDVTLPILKIVREDVGTDRGKEIKAVLYFDKTREDGSPARMVLNVTNAGTIADMYGNTVEDWAGKQITLYPTKCRMGRETVECIRVRDKVPPAVVKRGGKEAA